MKFRLLLLLLCFVAFGAKGQTSGKEPLPDALRFIDAWLEAQQVYDRIPGLSVALVKDQEVIWSKGYGLADVKRKIPATPQTVYSICSITKLFTSIAIMQLYDQGKLRLDDSLSTILPELEIRQQFSDSGPITIRSLLTHSSGLPREADFPYWTTPAFDFPTSEQILTKLETQETLYPVNTYFQYSNLGMVLLGQVVEKVSGEQFDTYILEHILKPLRLSDTYSRLPQDLSGNSLATGYSSLNREGTREVLLPFDTKGIQAAAGYASTALDLARFASWQFRLLANGGKEVLTSASLKEMQRVHWADPDGKINWGLGFIVFQNNGRTLTGHWGTCPGYRSLLLMDLSEKLACVVLINTMESPWKFAHQMRNILLKGSKEKNHQPSSIDLEEYTGTYSAQPWGSEKKVLSWYGNLAIVDLPSDNPLENMVLLHHVSGDVFRRIRRDDNLGEEIRFERDEKGKITRLWRHSNYSEKLR